MTRALRMRPAPRTRHTDTGPRLPLGELFAALAAGCALGAGLDALLDRVEGRA